MATAGLTVEEQKAVDRFRKDIVEPSMTKLVIVDFWAEWCGPCKALAPTLEKIAAEYADKGVVLAKINVDENRVVPGQHGIRGIPTLMLFKDGKVAATKVGALTKAQLTAFLDGHL